MSWFDWIPTIIEGVGLLKDKDNASSPTPVEPLDLEALARLMTMNTKSPWGGMNYTQGDDGRYTAEYSLGQTQPIFDRAVDRSMNPDQAYQMPDELRQLQSALMQQRLGNVGATGNVAPRPERRQYTPGGGQFQGPFAPAGSAAPAPQGSAPSVSRDPVGQSGGYGGDGSRYGYGSGYGLGQGGGYVYGGGSGVSFGAPGGGYQNGSRLWQGRSDQGLANSENLLDNKFLRALAGQVLPGGGLAMRGFGNSIGNELDWRGQQRLNPGTNWVDSNGNYVSNVPLDVQQGAGVLEPGYWDSVIERSTGGAELGQSNQREYAGQTIGGWTVFDTPGGRDLAYRYTGPLNPGGGGGSPTDSIWWMNQN